MLEFSQKKRKGFGDIILHLCNKKFSDMIYSSGDRERDRLKLVTFGLFLLFNP